MIRMLIIEHLMQEETETAGLQHTLIRKTTQILLQCWSSANKLEKRKEGAGEGAGGGGGERVGQAAS